MTRALFRSRHALVVALLLHELPFATTRAIIRYVGGHPAAVIRVLRSLETVGVVVRRRGAKDRRVVRVRLTVKGTQLIETPLYRWGRVLRKWDRV